MLLVVDIESVRRSTEDADAEGNDDASNDGLGHVERSGVDLHFEQRFAFQYRFRSIIPV